MKIYTSDNRDEIERDGITGETPHLFRCGRLKNGRKYYAYTVLEKSSLEYSSEEIHDIYSKLHDKVKEMMDKDELSPEKERS